MIKSETTFSENLNLEKTHKKHAKCDLHKNAQKKVLRLEKSEIRLKSKNYSSESNRSKSSVLGKPLLWKAGRRMKPGMPVGRDLIS